MNNLEAVEVLKNTGQIVTLIIARFKDREMSLSEDEEMRRQKEQRLDTLMVTSAEDDPYGIIFVLVIMTLESLTPLFGIGLRL